MAALNTDTFRKSAPLFSTTLNGAISNASTSIVLQSIAGLPTDTGISLVIDPVTATQTNAALQETVVGVISAGTVSLINALRGVEGTAQSHASGAAVYAYLTGTDWNALMAAILNDHVQGGYHNALHDINSKLWLDQSAVANAVNNWIAGNNAAGSGPTFNVEGSDTNIDGNLTGKGTGRIYVDGGAPQPYFNSAGVPWVESGCVITNPSGLNWQMTAGVVWVNGKRYNVPAQSSTAATASKDVYIDVLVGANQNSASQTIVVTNVANGAASPALAANSIRVGKLVTGASSISSIVQGGVDAVTTSGQLNFIYNTSPTAAPISTYVNGGTAGGTFYYRNQSGVKEVWGVIPAVSVSASGYSANMGINLPSNFFTAIQLATAASSVGGSNQGTITMAVQGITTSSVSVVMFNTGAGTNSSQAAVYIRGM